MRQSLGTHSDRRDVAHDAKPCTRHGRRRARGTVDVAHAQRCRSEPQTRPCYERRLTDATIVNVALPTIGRDFGVSATAVATISIAFLVSLAVFIPASGWLGDRFGGR